MPFYAERIKDDLKIYPSPKIQSDILDRLVKIDCHYRFVDDLTTEFLQPFFPGDKYFIFEKPFSIYNYFGLIHKDYLIPFLLNAKHGLELSANRKVTPEEIFSSVYKISLPIMDPTTSEYYIYEQCTYPLSINENNNEIFSHANTYTQGKKFRDELLHVEPIILRNNVSFKEYNLALDLKWSAYMRQKVFTSDENIILDNCYLIINGIKEHVQQKSGNVLESKLTKNKRSKEEELTQDKLGRILETSKIELDEERLITYDIFINNVKAIRGALKLFTGPNYNTIFQVVKFLNGKQFFKM